MKLGKSIILSNPLVTVYGVFHFNYPLKGVLLLSFLSAQRKSDNEQELSAFSCRLVGASVAEFHCCKLTPVLLTFFPDAEERRGFAEPSS
jgi:hypothetical protein